MSKTAQDRRTDRTKEQNRRARERLLSRRDSRSLRQLAQQAAAGNVRAIRMLGALTA